ncbi:MAG: hypothetical protein HQK77_14205 [Desulfobacterales bacterium]|nr:hypothetical protein [Desulfobacterales bacterium]
MKKLIIIAVLILAGCSQDVPFDRDDLIKDSNMLVCEDNVSGITIFILEKNALLFGGEKGMKDLMDKYTVRYVKTTKEELNNENNRSYLND